MTTEGPIAIGCRPEAGTALEGQSIVCLPCLSTGTDQGSIMIGLPDGIACA